jgi:hypothetical protein
VINAALRNPFLVLTDDGQLPDAWNALGVVTFDPRSSGCVSRTRMQVSDKNVLCTIPFDTIAGPAVGLGRMTDKRGRPLNGYIG